MILKKYVSYLFVIGMIVILYEWISIRINNELVVPRLKLVLEYLKNESLSFFLKQIIETLKNTVFGYILSIVIALVLAITANFKNFNYFINPVVSVLRTIPTISIIIIMILWFRSGEFYNVIGCLVVFPIIYEVFYFSIKNINHKLLEVCQVYQFSWWKKVKYLYFYHMVEQFLMSLKQTFGLAFKVMVMAEVIAQVRYGIGAQLQITRINHQVEGLIAWTLILIILVLVIEKGLTLISKLVIKWK